MKYEYTHFINENIAPKGATRIVVKKKISESEEADVCTIPAARFAGLTPPSGEPLYSFGLVSDCHTFTTTTSWDGNTKLRNALAYFNSQKNCVMVIGCGDFTQTGFYRRNDSKDNTITVTGTTVMPNRPDFAVAPLATYYDENQIYKHSQIIEESDIPVFEIFGNHENYNGAPITAETTVEGVVYNSLTRAKELTGIPATAYTVSSAPDSDEIDAKTVRPNRYAKIDNDLYLLCGQSTSSEVMSADDYAWLAKTLKDNKGRRCFVFVHSYMEEDSGDPLDYRENSIFSTWSKTAEFVALLKQYPNVILFHGHSHMKFGYQKDDPIANYATVKGYKSVHVPSLGMPRDINPDDTDGKYTPEDIKSSQCYRVDVYTDCIVLNGLELGTTGVPSVEVLGTLKINT